MLGPVRAALHQRGSQVSTVRFLALDAPKLELDPLPLVREPAVGITVVSNVVVIVANWTGSVRGVHIEGWDFDRGTRSGSALAAPTQRPSVVAPDVANLAVVRS